MKKTKLAQGSVLTEDEALRLNLMEKLRELKTPAKIFPTSLFHDKKKLIFYFVKNKRILAFLHRSTIQKELRGEMKVKEVLEMTLEKPISAIAKEHLPFGEKILRSILKELGAQHESGKKGWHLKARDPELLEKNIEEFAPTKATKKPKASINKSIHAESTSSISKSKNAIISNIENDTRKENNMKNEIEALIKGTSKEAPERVYKGVYFDKDIAQFLDGVQHGNKSELINKVLRAYLTENGLMK